MGPIENKIEEKVTSQFEPLAMELANESSMHAGPATESHFKLFLVSSSFQGLSRIDRQRSVFSLLDEELRGPVHALSLRLLTPEEWEKQNKASMPASPDCAGANKD